MRFVVGALKLIGLLVLLIIAIPLGWLAFSFAASPFFPPYTFSAICTYDLTYRLTLTIDVGGKQYTSEVVHQQSRSREWISVMNSAGCQQTHGTTVPFRLADNRTILVRSQICGKAQQAFAGSREYYYKGNFKQAMATNKKIDVTKFCTGISMDRPYLRRFIDGFVIDNADHPTRWKGFEFGDPLPDANEVVRLVSATAEATDIWPADDLDRIAPAILKTSFKYKDWFNSPESVLNFFRRYNPDKRFVYQAEHY